MKKYLLFVILVAVSLTADLVSKTWAEDNLASAGRAYEHFLYLDVAEAPEFATLGELLTDEFSGNTEEEITQIGNGATFLVNDEGVPIRRGYLDLSLSGGERFEVRSRGITVIDGFLSYRYVENRGAAWGFLSESSPSFRQPFFIIVGIFAMIVILFLFRSVDSKQLFLVSALALIVGGAFGNIVDRIRYGYVVDFISCYPGFEWPTFNIADSVIVVGVGMMFIQVIRDHFRQRGEAESDSSEESATPAG